MSVAGAVRVGNKVTYRIYHLHGAPRLAAMCRVCRSCACSKAFADAPELLQVPLPPASPSTALSARRTQPLSALPGAHKNHESRGWWVPYRLAFPSLPGSNAAYARRHWRSSLPRGARHPELLTPMRALACSGIIAGGVEGEGAPPAS